jgi:hypothetical protein
MNRQSAPQPGGVLTLIAATAFAPLAWNHYFVILVVPVMIFLERWMADGRLQWLGVTAAVCVLNLPPLAATATSPLAVIALRSPFLAALLCILALPFTSGGRFAGQIPDLGTRGEVKVFWFFSLEKNRFFFF